MKEIGANIRAVRMYKWTTKPITGYLKDRGAYIGSVRIRKVLENTKNG